MQNLFTGGFRNLKSANCDKSDCNLDYRHQPQHGSQFGGAVPVVSGELDCNNGSQWFDKDSFFPPFRFFPQPSPPFKPGRKCAGGVRNL